MRASSLKLLATTLLALSVGVGRGSAQPASGAPPPAQSAPSPSSSAEPVRLTAALGHGVLPAGRAQTTFLKVGLAGLAAAPAGRRASINLAIVLDRSQSMSGERLDQAKQAAVALMDKLGPEDVVSVVAYGETVTIPIGATRVSNTGELGERIGALAAAGSTALFAGVAKGAQEVRKFLEPNRVQRVLLLSDGNANLGPSSPGELGQLGMALGKQGIGVTTIGLGDGYNEDLMVALARASDGNHAYAGTGADLSPIFQLELADLFGVVARDAWLTVRFHDGARAARALGRDAEIAGSAAFAHVADIQAGHEKFLLLEVTLPAGAAGERRPIADVELRYQDPVGRRPLAARATLEVAYSDSPDEVEGGLDKGVLAAGAALVANEANKQAVALRDQGKTEQAVALLERNAVFLDEKAREYGSDELRKRAELNRQHKQQMPAPAAWKQTRKRMYSDQYSEEMQPAWAY